MRNESRKFVTALIVIMLLLCGCGKKQSTSNTYREEIYEDYYTDYAYEYDMEDGDMAYVVSDSYAAYEPKAVPSAAESSNTQQRMVRKSASINVQVLDPIQTMEAIMSLTEEMGGFVVSSSSSQEYYSGDIYLPRADLTIRVPSERLTEMLSFIENQTTDSSKYVSNKRIYGVDITSDYVDTQSRLTSLEKTRDKLYEIMDTAENAEEALEVYNNIASVESDIEVYKGQIKYMEESVALSSVDVKINSVKPEPIRTVQKWSIGEVVKDAFESLLDSAKDVIEWLIYFFIAVLPILILMILPVILVILLIRWLIRRNKSKKQNVQVSEKNSEKQDDEEDALVKVKK